MNRLKDETSPYLRQHQDNPVDWYPWGQAAFKAAAEADKPILLSVGYSACHWCHVMAHESFEDPATARMMNALFINVKVDREERPDVDSIYMQAVQAFTGGHGGWPMTVFLLPDGKPFHGGTYFPREARYGMPSFSQVMQAVADAYTNRREDLAAHAEKLTVLLESELSATPDDTAVSVALLNSAAKRLIHTADDTYGGWGPLPSRAPKFPQPMTLEFLLRDYLRTGNEAALETATFTLRKMAEGGIYDQIGGGFARYSVDAHWLVPHFEKMLYDNAQLSRVYLHAWQVTKEPLFRQIAEEIYDYLLREMTAPEGGFYSATDADSEGEEGKFFVWSVEALEMLLGDDAPLAMAYWGVTRGGNFEGHTILHVAQSDANVAAQFGITTDAVQQKVAGFKQKLYAARQHRVHPGLDDKILTAWNGLMLASLAEAARVLQREDYLTAALRCADYLLTTLSVENGRLLRTAKGTQARLNAFLEDYANMADALLEMYQTTFEERYFEAARTLTDSALKHFASADGGGFYDTSDDHETLIVRPRSLQDNATPAGNTMLAKQCLRLAAYTGDATYSRAAEQIIGLLTAPMQEYPTAFAEGLNAAEMLVSGIAEVALVGDPNQQDMQALLATLWASYRPNVVVALTPEDAVGEAPIPLLSYRTQRNGAATAYVCRNFACKMPVTLAEALENQLRSTT